MVEKIFFFSKTAMQLLRWRGGCPVWSSMLSGISTRFYKNRDAKPSKKKNRREETLPHHPRAEASEAAIWRRFPPGERCLRVQRSVHLLLKWTFQAPVFGGYPAA
jgi:hypothetical protein